MIRGRLNFARSDDSVASMRRKFPALALRRSVTIKTSRGVTIRRKQLDKIHIIKNNQDCYVLLVILKATISAQESTASWSKLISIVSSTSQIVLINKFSSLSCDKINCMRCIQDNVRVWRVYRQCRTTRWVAGWRRWGRCWPRQVRRWWLRGSWSRARTRAYSTYNR